MEKGYDQVIIFQECQEQLACGVFEADDRRRIEQQHVCSSASWIKIEDLI